MSQTFERVIDRKDSIVQSLARDLEEAEEQYQVALRTHTHNVDQLIGKPAMAAFVCGDGSLQYFVSCRLSREED